MQVPSQIWGRIYHTISVHLQKQGEGQTRFLQTSNEEKGWDNLSQGRRAISRQYATSLTTLTGFTKRDSSKAGRAPNSPRRPLQKNYRDEISDTKPDGSRYAKTREDGRKLGMFLVNNGTESQSPKH